MTKKVGTLNDNIKTELINIRRDFHKYPESGWTEFRTASRIAKLLAEEGIPMKLGRDVIKDEARMGLPSEEELSYHYQRAVDQGADPEFLSYFKGGFTGVFAVIDTGKPGPHTAIRVDIDANDLQETDDPAHRPNKEGFASINSGVMHACGHDAHAAIGIGLAKTVHKIKNSLKGKVSVIFQPAEEGVRGAKSMVEAGLLDDVDCLLGVHIGIGVDNVGMISTGKENFLSTTKFDVTFKGSPAHAGGSPNEGKNALIAASTAVTGLYGISRHKKGRSRINVGQLTAGSGRNVIPAEAVMKMETRGETTEINDYMVERAKEVVDGASKMQDVSYQIREVGGAPSAISSPELVDQIKDLIQKHGQFSWYGSGVFSGSEDFAYMMNEMLEKDKAAAYLIFGTSITSGHHTYEFDFDESVISYGVEFLAKFILDKNK